MKRKHDGEKKEEKRGRPRKIDKERALMSTPLTHVHVSIDRKCITSCEILICHTVEMYPDFSDYIY